MMNLDELRNEIDKIDTKLVELLEKRMETVTKIADFKRKNNISVLNQSREDQVIKKVQSLVKNESMRDEFAKMFVAIMEISKEYQSKILASNATLPEDAEPKVGFYGVAGSFSEQAAKEYFGDAVNAVAINEFEDIFIALRDGDIKYGVVPIENSSTGAISDVYDLLYKYEAYIVGEKYLKISQNLLGVKGATLDEIVEVYSHPQGLEQSKEFLKSYKHWKLVPYQSTAKCAELVKARGEKSIAAIGSLQAAEIYGLEVLQPSVNSNAHNMTRFVVISRDIAHCDDCKKVSLIFSTAHKAGSLFNVLKHFADNNLSLMKIESRPMKDRPWEYFFYVDFEGNLEEEVVKTSIAAVKDNSHYFKILGNYKREIF